MRKTFVKASICALALAIGVFVGSPAQALVAYGMYTDDSNPGGYVAFYPDGDRFAVCDHQHDDYAYVQVLVWDATADPNIWIYELWDYSANGVCTSVDRDNYDLVEGHCIRVLVRLVKNGVVISSSADSAQWRNYNDRKANCDSVV